MYFSTIRVQASARRHFRVVSAHLRNRDGAAMFMALGALIIIGVLVAASSMVSLQENRLGQNQLAQSRAFASAEYGLNKIQADWDRTPNLAMANGAKFDTTYQLDEGTANVRYVRLNNDTFWIVSEGLAMVGNNVSVARQGRKRIGAILRIRFPSIKAEGAITTAGNVESKGSSKIRGENTLPPGWDAGSCSPATDKAAIVASPTATVTIQKPANVTGSPQITRSTLATDSNTYVRYGDETWSALQAQAITLDPSASGGTPTTVNGVCNKADPGNWGEPHRGSGKVAACYDYYPILYFTGDVHLNGGRGQGIMLVNGDFRVNGNFEWHGLIIVRDDIDKSNGSALVYGAMMSRNAITADNEMSGDFTGSLDLFYSACALERAMRGSALVVQAKERSWTELY